MNEQTAFASIVISLVICCTVVIFGCMSCDRNETANRCRTECVKTGKTPDDCARMIQP